MSFLSNITNQTFILRGAVLLVSISFLHASADDTKLESFKDKLSYAVGVNLASSIKGAALSEVDSKILAQGVVDVLNDKELQLTDEEIIATFQEESKIQQQGRSQLIEDNQAKADEFFAENQKRDGVTTLENGLQYEVLEASTKEDAKQAAKDSVVLVHYQGELLNGNVFDSSYERGQPIEIPLTSVIPGWTELVSLMKEGDKWKLFIPGQFAYGEQGSPGIIGPNEALIFDVELLEVK